MGLKKTLRRTCRESCMLWGKVLYLVMGRVRMGQFSCGPCKGTGKKVGKISFFMFVCQCFLCVNICIYLDIFIYKHVYVFIGFAIKIQLPKRFDFRLLQHCTLRLLQCVLKQTKAETSKELKFFFESYVPFYNFSICRF